ncbi:hypothetical protein D3P09_10650 [Paenibacillus pinisoli]|uniref:Uncharacterized protein n=1 Tax=Paenibacillus pinisoli TaxID=1276110 RepID=A0A3A6PG42_9BACL|nr:hypothetical protein D3P09_10650 [Paenibacillus pinisoli]
MLLIVLLLIPTVLITIRSFSKSERLNRAISRVTNRLRSAILWVGLPVLLIHAVYRIITNWSSFTWQDTMERLGIVAAGGILGFLMTRLLTRMESKGAMTTKEND